tara:strand:- start:97 stop:390 length:294 start_codon:yes stop_codon:yes gene_type:complete
MKKQIDNKNLYVELYKDKEIYYSYNTVVAVKTLLAICVARNIWSKTTARHLNKIDEILGSSKKDRVSYDTFNNFCYCNQVNISEFEVNNFIVSRYGH